MCPWIFKAAIFIKPDSELPRVLPTVAWINKLAFPQDTFPQSSKDEPDSYKCIMEQGKAGWESIHWKSNLQEEQQQMPKHSNPQVESLNDDVCPGVEEVSWSEGGEGMRRGHPCDSTCFCNYLHLHSSQ